MDKKTKVIIAAASALVALGTAALIGKRVLKADEELWEAPTLDPIDESEETPATKD